MGWNSTPRCDSSSEWKPTGYPFMNTIGNNTPENFKKALQITKEKVLSNSNSLKILNINCWNEWTEGSYLEPDTIQGMAYLNAVREVYSDYRKTMKNIQHIYICILLILDRKRVM